MFARTVSAEAARARFDAYEQRATIVRSGLMYVFEPGTTTDTMVEPLEVFFFSRYAEGVDGERVNAPVTLVAFSVRDFGAPPIVFWGGVPTADGPNAEHGANVR